MRRNIALMVGAAAALAISREVAADRAQAITPQELERRTAGPTRGQRKALARGVERELLNTGKQTIVLGHIHPRWLREEIARRFDAGETISDERIEQLRAIGAGW